MYPSRSGKAAPSGRSRSPRSLKARCAFAAAPDAGRARRRAVRPPIAEHDYVDAVAAIARVVVARSEERPVNLCPQQRADAGRAVDLDPGPGFAGSRFDLGGSGG